MSENRIKEIVLEFERRGNNDQADHIYNVQLKRVTDSMNSVDLWAEVTHHRLSNKCTFQTDWSMQIDKSTEQITLFNCISTKRIK